MQYQIVFLLILRPKSVFAGSSTFLMCCSPSVFDWEQTFPSAMCNGSLMAPSRHRPELDDPPVAVMVNVWGSCWQFFTLGVASSFGTWWRCVIVLVGILVANYFAILAVQLTGFCFELADAAKDSPARLLMPENKGFTTTEKLTNCFGWVWCASWCWPEVSSGVHVSPVNDPTARMSASCCVVLTHLIWITGFELMGS